MVRSLMTDKTQSDSMFTVKVKLILRIPPGSKICGIDASTRIE